MKYFLQISFFVIISTVVLQAQTLTTQGNISAEELIQDSLISGCVTASNITTNSSTSFGYFSCTNTAFPFESGLIMASGDISNAEGPDEATSTGSSTYSGSDDDLQLLIPAYSVNDATVMEFDFVPASDTIEFNYIFGSEEFPEFANSSFNDVFGFFLSGPGISGSYSNNAINIAILPNGDPVTIDNLFNNSIYYTGSETGSGSEGLAYGNCIQYDGASISLTARANVTACETYHIKLAIGDAGDHVYDSGVFLEAGSFTSGVQINTVSHSDVGSESDLYEGCTNYFVIERETNSPIAEEVVIYINYLSESTAEEYVDVTEIVDSAYLAPYETQDTIWYSALNDGIEEGTETMLFEFWTTCPCGNGGGNSVIDTIYIYDAEGIKGGIQDLEPNYCGETPPPTLDIIASVNIVPAFYLWSTGSTNDTITIVPQAGAETYYVTISDQCGNEIYDSVTIRVSSMEINNIINSPVSCYNNCNGGIEIQMINDFAPFSYKYGNANFFYITDSITTTNNPIIQGLCPNDYYLKITDSIGCYIETEFSIQNKPNIILSDGILSTQTEYCEIPDNITLNASAVVADANFLWWNGTTSSEVNFSPMIGAHDYSVSITDGCGNLFTDAVTIIISNLSAVTYYEPDNNNCDGEVWVIPENGIAPYTYYWYTPLASFGQYQEEVCYGDYTVLISDDIGCTTEASVNVPLFVTVNGENSDKVKIYPNPSRGSAFIDLSGLSNTGTTIKITNITGQIIGIYKTTKNLFKTPELLPGSYFIEIYGFQNVIIKDKLIITE
jgi:hypothetical protein